MGTLTAMGKTQKKHVFLCKNAEKKYGNTTEKHFLCENAGNMRKNDDKSTCLCKNAGKMQKNDEKNIFFIKESNFYLKHAQFWEF